MCMRNSKNDNTRTNDMACGKDSQESDPVNALATTLNTLESVLIKKILAGFKEESEIM